MTGSKGVPRRTALGLLVTGALAGCGLDPDSTIRPGLDVDAPVDNSVDVIPAGPRSGQSPQAIIEGFFRAGATSGRRLDTAREFLTEDCARGWNPDLNQTVVYPSVRDPFEFRWLGDNTYEVSVRVAARIDQDARYLVAPTNDGASFEFGLVTVDGEWRIDEMQTSFGRLLSTATTDRLYRQYNVHFPASGSNVLVPDERWVLEEQQATRLARVQLGGTPAYLENAVVPATGAELAVESVPIHDTVARVDLASDSVTSDVTGRKRLAAQLVATLMQIPDASEVAITLDGSPMSVPGVEGPLTTPEQLDFVNTSGVQDPAVLARVGEGLVQLVGSPATVSTRRLWSGHYRFRADEHWTRLGLRPDGNELAGVTDKGHELVRWRAGNPSNDWQRETVRVPPFAANLTRPCYDFGSVLWVGGVGLGTEVGNRLFHVNTRADLDDLEESAPQHVPSPWLGTNYVVAAVVSPDGSRIAVVSEEYPGTGSQLWVSGVVRETNGLPTSTSPKAVQAAANLVEMTDAVWVGATTLAVVGRRDEETTMHPFVVDVNGEVTELSWPPKGSAAQGWRAAAQTVTTTGGEDDILVTSVDGRVWQRLGGSGWTEIEHVDGIVVAGV